MKAEVKKFDGMVVCDESITMRDGTVLAARVYRLSKEGSYPVLYCGSPYQYDTDHLPDSSVFPWYEVGPLEWYVKDQGYAFVHLDVRGSGHSEGEWDPWSVEEREDHREVLDWIAAAEWCSGKIGSYGQSYYCMTQWLMAVSGTDKLACLGAFDGACDYYRHLTYRGGIANQFFNFWSNLVTMSYATRMDPTAPRRVMRNPMPDIVAHQTDDEFWRSRSPVWDLDTLDVPVYSIGVWGKRDLHLQGNLDAYNLVKGDKKLLVINPDSVIAAHHVFTTIDFHEEYLLPFYNYYLKGDDNGWKEKTPDVKYWVYGKEQFREDTTWPPSAINGKKSLYLSAGPTGSISSLNDGRLVAEKPSGAQQPESAIVAKGWLKASHRAIDDVMSEKLGRTMYSDERPKLLNPGQVYKLDICLTGCAHLFRKGNRIRLDVSNTDSGLTDGQFASIYHWEKVGTDTYYHSQACPSRLILSKIQ
jgi:putative CocE/NonD family hydrolase